MSDKIHEEGNYEETCLGRDHIIVSPPLARLSLII